MKRAYWVNIMSKVRRLIFFGMPSVPGSLLLILCFMLLSSFAMGDTASALYDPSKVTGFTPPATDFSVAYLENLFGVVDGVLHGTGSQLMGAMFKVFNGAVLALGGIVILFTIIVGTMNTAHEGEMLGKKWSSVWIPLRSTMGLALLLPKTSGYCLIQIFVMWVIVQGVGAADKVWNSALDYLNTGGVIIQANMNAATSLQADDSAVATGALALLGGQACMLGLQKQMETQRQIYLDQEAKESGPCYGTPTSDMAVFCSTPVPDFLASVNAVQYQTDMQNNMPKDENGKPQYIANFTLLMPYFTSGEYAYLNGICGSINWNNISEADLKEISGMSGISSSDMTSTMLSRATAIQQMYLDFSPMVERIVANNPSITPSTTATTDMAYSDIAVNAFGVPYLSTGETLCTNYENCTIWGGQEVSGKMFPAILSGSEFQDAIADYNAIMSSTVKLINDARSSDNGAKERDFIENAEAHGWLTAGSYFFDLVYLNGSASPTTETDTNTGLDLSRSTPEVLTAPFGEGVCTSTMTEYSKEYIQLCTWFQTDKTKITVVQQMMSPSGLTFDNVKLVNTTSTAMGGKEANSVYGVSVNERIIQQPDQPSMTPPKFQMNFNFKMSKSLFELPKQDFDCAPAIPGGPCVGRKIASALYNHMARPVLDFFFGGLASVMNLVVMACLSLPLALFSVAFMNGVSFIQNPGNNPIVSLANMGTRYINFAAELWLNMFMITQVVGFFSPFAVIMIGVASPLLLAWTGIFVAIGFSTAYYVPFLPFMIFTFGVIGWLMAVVEAMVAAPIVALGITHPDGDGALGKGDQSILMLMNVFLRPAMMIFGYLAAIALCYVSVWILNAGYSHAMQFVQGDSQTGEVWKGGENYVNWAGIYGFFFSILFYTTMYMTVAQKSFNLIYTLPDHIMTWIGGPASQVGQETAQWGEEMKQKTAEAATESQKVQAQLSKGAQGAAVTVGNQVVEAVKDSVGGQMGSSS
jgi:defect in organelle trafficking protein DotA